MTKNDLQDRIVINTERQTHAQKKLELERISLLIIKIWGGYFLFKNVFWMIMMAIFPNGLPCSVENIFAPFFYEFSVYGILPVLMPITFIIAIISLFKKGTNTKIAYLCIFISLLSYPLEIGSIVFLLYCWGPLLGGIPLH